MKIGVFLKTECCEEPVLYVGTVNTVCQSSESNIRLLEHRKGGKSFMLEVPEYFLVK